MAADPIKAVSAQLRTDLREHWRGCLADGLDDHSPKAHKAVDKSLDAYFKEMRSCAKSRDKAQILAGIERLFLRLDEVLERFGEGLLETDERELIVPAVLEAAKLAGLNLAEFPDEDPTGEFRNF